ncbi:hypothetical protein Q3G72_025763 [Acer saccharum]|nr:hypothetical protein Q3G72_025763 [Acer saccharum]
MNSNSKPYTGLAFCASENRDDQADHHSRRCLSKLSRKEVSTGATLKTHTSLMMFKGSPRSPITNMRSPTKEDECPKRGEGEPSV